MRRREFIAGLSSVIATPLAARADQEAPTVGFLSGRSLHSDRHLVAAFRKGMAETGFAEGKNIKLEFRWADGQLGRLLEMATDLARRKPAVIFAGAIDVRIKALKDAISDIPMVFATGGDLVELGIVESLNRPGGNVTGITVQAAELWPKQIEILRDLIGPKGTIALLVNPNNATAKASVRDIQTAAEAIKQNIFIVNATSEREFEPAFAALVQQRAGALLVAIDALFINRRDRIVALAAKAAMPAIYGRSEFVTAGGLISYGASAVDQYRQSGLYVGRILNGTKPADLPVLQPTKFELAINLKTAKDMGIIVPPQLLARADEVIE
jgi:putative ABC transport system substrate-binding protein